MKKTKRWVSVLLAVVMVLSIIPMTAVESSATGGVKAKLDSFIASYPSGSRWTGTFDGGSQCYGFGKMVIYNIFGKNSSNGYRSWSYAGVSTSGMDVIGSITSFSASNVQSLLSKAKCGDVLQFNTTKQHTMIVYSVDSSGVTIYDCNWDNNCGISKRYCSFGTWSGRNSSKLTLLRADNYETIDGPEQCNCSTSYAGNYICTTSSSPLTIRSGHGTSYSAIGSIPSGATVYVSKADGTWAHVTYNGISGYASMEYLQKSGNSQYYVDVWASTKGQGYGPSECPALTSGYAGNAYYIWFKIAEKTTGEIYSGTNYKSKISISYPDGTVLGSYTYDNSGTNWIRVTPDVKGTYKIRIQLSGNITADYSKDFIVKCDGKVAWKTTSLSLNIPTKTSATLQGSLTGTYPSGAKFKLDYDESIISLEKGDGFTYTVTALAVGKTDLVITTMDKVGNYISSATCKITVTADTYTITYNANGGTGAPPAQTKTHGVNITLSTVKPTKTGYSFVKWTSGSNGSGYTFYSGDNYIYNVSMPLYAQYTPIQYTIKYNANGGTGSMANSSHTYDTAKALTANTFTRTGYTFLGWSTGATATSAKYADKESVKNLTATNGGTVTLYAVWQPNRYTVVTNANGGTGTALESTFRYDTIGTLPSNSFTRTGYTFLGWSTSPTATTPTYTDKQSVKNLTTTNGGTVTLYAVWKANTYTVAYNANGGTGSMSSSSHTYDTAKALTANAFTRTGYTFLGWSTSATATTPTYTNKQSVKNLTATNGGTVTLYAVWKKTAPATAYGDANGDGMVDAGDAVLVSRYDAGEIALTAEQLKACDVNGDGIVDAGDAVLISRYDAGLINFFPVICVTVPELPNVK